MSNTLKNTKRSLTASVLALLIALFLPGSPLALAASWQVIPSPSPGANFNDLNGVAVVSATDVWTVGISASTSTQTLIEHWNGTNWQVVSSPNPSATDNSLNGVAVVNATNIWSVGSYQNGSNPSQTLIEHWNGKSWKVVSSPNIALEYNQLVGVVALSTTNLWAVGYTRNSNGITQTLIEHWNGSSWKIIASPNVGAGSNSLNGVAAISDTNLWAVGSSQNSNGIPQTLTEYWNGKSWQVVSSPNSGTIPNQLSGVAAISANNLWAVGYDGAPSSPPTQTLIEHWNGKNWQIVPSPNSGTAQNSLMGVTAISGTNIWAVGSYENVNAAPQTLIEHWTGNNWKVVPGSNPGTAQNFLNGVAAVSSSELWAVGSYANTNNSPLQTLIEEYR